MKNKSSMLDTAVVLLLMGMFVLLSIGVMVLGISVYNNTNKLSSENYAQRTVLSYIANQVRRGDTGGGIEVRDIDGVRALVFRQDFDGTDYLTCLYAHDGELRELFTEDGSEQELASGVPIMPVTGLSFAIRDGLIEVQVTDEASEVPQSLLLSPRSGVNGG
ncbi:MAG: DUF4860 domain-containing protein [Clostridiales Family XIII bacterium]|jgi:hypothetical protein|nr:DUF4860 domain-containing protein [Clostridiales Family XIII bacterium]